MSAERIRQLETERDNLRSMYFQAIELLKFAILVIDEEGLTDCEEFRQMRALTGGFGAPR